MRRAPPLISGDLRHLWIDLTAPLLGMALAVPAHRLCTQESSPLRPG
ncbi:MAG: hypothetical protein KF724_06980 [Phycisphaeraceae bacterium]|nr:hypothetical protein [Phycisphaeraceae bacterium]